MPWPPWAIAGITISSTFKGPSLGEKAYCLGLWIFKDFSCFCIKPTGFYSCSSPYSKFADCLCWPAKGIYLYYLAPGEKGDGRASNYILSNYYIIPSLFAIIGDLGFWILFISEVPYPNAVLLRLLIWIFKFFAKSKSSEIIANLF